MWQKLWLLWQKMWMMSSNVGGHCFQCQKSVIIPNFNTKNSIKRLFVLMLIQILINHIQIHMTKILFMLKFMIPVINTYLIFVLAGTWCFILLLILCTRWWSFYLVNWPLRVWKKFSGHTKCTTGWCTQPRSTQTQL